MLGLSWLSLMSKGLRSGVGQGSIQRWCGEVSVRRRSRFSFLSAAVVWRTQLAFQILHLPFCVPDPISDDQTCTVFRVSSKSCLDTGGTI